MGYSKSNENLIYIKLECKVFEVVPPFTVSQDGGYYVNLTFSSFSIHNFSNTHSATGESILKVKPGKKNKIRLDTSMD